MKTCIKQSVSLSLLAIWLGSNILAACSWSPMAGRQFTPTPPVTPTTQATIQVDATGTLSAEPVEPVPDGCPIEDQIPAMRSGQPAWDETAVQACYELELSIGENPAEYAGKARIVVPNRTGSAYDDLVFRLYPNADRIYGGRLELDEARVAGQPVEPEQLLADGTAVRLALAEPVPPGKSIEVELAFSGQTPVDLNNQEWVYGVFNFDSGDQVLVLANWFPILAAWRDGDWQVEPVYGVGDAVVSETALFELEVTAPKDWQVITTGSEIGRTEWDGGVVRTFASGPVRDFIVVASPNFVGQQMETYGVLVHHWGLPGGEGRWDEALQATVDALGVFEQRFGPYPYAELDVVAAPLQLASGVEYPGLFLLESQLYQPDDEQPFLLGLVAAHEVAHQWWYSVVGSDVVAHPWQDEALATFSSLVYQEEYQPGVLAGTIRHYQGRQQAAEDSKGDTGIGQPVQAFLDRIEIYSPVIYSKGALFFVDLRQEIGEEAFFKALKSYYAKYTGRIASPEELLGEFENACQCDLDQVYAFWGVD